MHTIIHIGAGQAAELGDWLKAGAEHIVLVEPNPTLAETLRQNTSGEPRVTVVEAAITTNPANNLLHEYNLPEASSLRPATGLKQLFPGLKTVNTHSVATLTPAQLMEQYGPEPGEPATLVLQAPGEEHAIIQALAEAEVLSYFSELWVTTNPEPLYEDSEAAETLLNTLQTLGYNVQQENQQDPDWPTWQLARDPQQDKIAALEKELQSLEQQLKESRTSLLDITHQKESLESQLTQARNQAAEAEKAKTAEAERANTAEQKVKQAEAAFSAKVQAEQSARKQLEQLKQQLAEKEKQQQQQEENLAKQAEQLKALAEEKEQQKIREQNLHAEIKELHQKAQDLTKAREALAEEQGAHQQTTKALEDHKQWFRSRKVQAEELQAENAQLKTELEQLKTVLEATKQEKQQLLQSQTTGQNALSQLEQKMEHLFSQQASQLQQAANALGQHVTRSFKDQRQHIQNVASLETYFETGTQPLEFGQWAIGADLGSHLVRAIEQNNYDLIIEFGSGTSTVLLARSILNRSAATTTNTQNKSLEYDSKNDTKDSGAIYDLPQRILSFEQNKAYQQKTEAALAREGLSNLVDLVLAPMVPVATYSEHNSPLFYDCNAKLARIAQLYEGRQARLLVLVDGPHSPEANPLVREPALGCILQHLSAHRLDIILDDAWREGEQQVIQAWQQTCQQRGLNHQYQTLDTEKGAAWFTIAP